MSNRKYPYQESIPLKYQDSDEPMSGNGSTVNRMPKEQKLGYELDYLLDLEAIRSKLRQNGYELDNELIDVKLIADPLFTSLKGIQPKNNQSQLLPKYYSSLYQRRELTGVLADTDALTTSQIEYAKGLYDPHARASKAKLRDLIEFEKGWTLPTKEMSDKNYRGDSRTRAKGSVAKVLPAREQFSPEVQALEFGDIFTIFRDAQLEQVKLFLGRVCVGHSGTTDPFTGETLLHTYRNILVVDGQYPGQGKSTLFKYVTDALDVAGYSVCNSVPPLSGRFNLREAFTSDLSYRDDENSDNLAKELSSPVAKVMATGGVVATEDKGKDAVSTKCTTALLINANRLERRLFWGMDDGMRSRVTICETVPEGVLTEAELPFVKIPRLAKELGVDISTIMLWALRLATDEFCKYTNSNAHKLEKRVKELEASANKSNADPLDGVLAAIALGNLIMSPDAPVSPKMNLDTLNRGIAGMMYLKQSEDYQAMAYELMDTLTDVDGRTVIPGWHPIQGLALVDPLSLPIAYDMSQNRANMKSPNYRMREVFECLSLSDGNQCYGRPDVTLPRWTQLISNSFTFGRLKELAASIIAHKPEKPVALPTDVCYTKDSFWSINNH